MIWILLIAMTMNPKDNLTTGVSIHSVEFSSQKNCEDAAKRFAYGANKGLKTLYVFECVKK